MYRENENKNKTNNKKCSNTTNKTVVHTKQQKHVKTSEFCQNCFSQMVQNGAPVLIYTLDIFRGIDPTTTKEI